MVRVAVNNGGVNAVTPARILDTRTSTGGHQAALGQGETFNLNVLGGSGVPYAGVSAVVVNVTVVHATLGSYLTIFPAGVTRPTASTINFTANQTVANGAVVKVGSNGQISIYNLSGTVDVIVDVLGWVGNGTSAAQTVTVTPNRVLDTNTTNGGHNAPLNAGETMTLPVLGTHGIPSTGISAIVANVTAVPGTNTGYLTLFPTGQSLPGSSTLSTTSPGTAVANLAVIPVGTGGSINIYSSTANTRAIVDVIGWVTSGDPLIEAGTKAIPAVRVLDTRTTLGGYNRPMGPGYIFDVAIAGNAGVPSSGVSAAIVHVTSVHPTDGGYITAYAAGTPRPSSSTINFNSGTIVSNTVLVPVGSNGNISLYNLSGYVDVIVDIQGWVASPSVALSLANSISYTPIMTDSIRAQQILLSANKYAVNTWWSTIAPALISSMPVPDAQNDPQDTVRRLSMEAFSLAISLESDTYDSIVTGVSAVDAESMAVQLIDVVVSHHVTNTPNGWGHTWQSTMWSNYVGRAAWLLWAGLSSTLQQQVTKMINYEADYAAGDLQHYMRGPDGSLWTPGDTGAEDSWKAQPIQLALAMFPGHPHESVWRSAMVRIALACWARQSDVFSSTVVNGAPIYSWIHGSNVEADGTVINHNRLAPDYSNSIGQNMDGVIACALAGQTSPQALTQFLPPVYNAFRNVNFLSPPYLTPGGTYYTAGAAIYYPQGIDWGTGQMLPFALSDAMVAACGVNTTTAPGYEDLHANAVLAQQARFTDGRTYLDSTEYNYVGREEHTAQLAGQLFLIKWAQDNSLISFNNDNYTV